jgi:hypothetical protein
MRMISHCRYGGEITVDGTEFDDPVKFLAFAKTMVRQKLGSRAVGGIWGRYLWQEIWTAAAKPLGFEGDPAPEWLIYEGALLVRDRFINGDIIHLFIDGEQLRGHIWSMANGARVVREAEAQMPGVFQKTEERRAAS